MQGWLVILIRSMVMLFITLILIRVMGKRQPARMNPFNFVNYMVIALIAGLVALNVIANLAFGLIALGVWVLIPIALDYLSVKSKWVHDVLNGKEAILIKQGKIMERNLMRSRLTGEELLRELRSKNVFNLSEVEFALMETTGDINVLLKSDHKPVTPHDMEHKVAPQTEPQTIILDGNLLDEPLASMGLNREWLKLQLDKLGVALNNVFVGQVNSYGELYIDLFDDAIKLPQPKVREMLYINLVKVQADLMIFAIETAEQAAKSMYTKNAAKMEQVLEKLKPYLLR